MLKHIFFKLQIFVFLRGNSKYVRVLAVCNTQENIFFVFQTYIYIYIFATFHGKTKYFNTRFVFSQYKKI